MRMRGEPIGRAPRSIRNVTAGGDTFRLWCLLSVFFLLVYLD